MIDTIPFTPKHYGVSFLKARETEKLSHNHSTIIKCRE